MKFYKICLVLCFSPVTMCLSAINLADITYESMKNDVYTDHVRIFNSLFNQVKINSIVEFGLGIGTNFFLDNVESVSSIEMLCTDQNDEWYNRCLDLYSSYKNWNPSLFQGSDLLTWANRVVQRREDPALINSEYILELQTVIEESTKNNPEIAFVDCGVHNRGDMVNLLFGRVDIIVAHDTTPLWNVYGWDKIKIPSNYLKFVFQEGQGTTFWVRDSRQDVIDALSNIKKLT